MSTEDRWPASDSLLFIDPIAASKVSHPFDPPELETSGGIILPDVEDDDANEAAAAAVLAEMDGDDIDLADLDEDGHVDDDEAEDDPADSSAVDPDV